MNLIFTTWLWGDKYGIAYADRLFAAVARNCSMPHRRMLITNQPPMEPRPYEVRAIPPQDLELVYERGCFARLRLFDAVWQRTAGIGVGTRVVNVDLDAVITGNIDRLSWQSGGRDFRILQDVNTTNPCPYNGSIWAFDGGTRHDAWDDFSLRAAAKLPYHAFPDDQGWFHHKFPDAAKFGAEDGVYAFKKRGWPSGDDLPEDARFVAFPGWRDPSKFTHIPWVKQHWRV